MTWLFCVEVEDVVLGGLAGPVGRGATVGAEVMVPPPATVCQAL